MKDEVKTFIALLLEELGTGTRWIVVGALVLLLVGMFGFYEHVTSHFYYRNIQTHIDVLERLNSLSNNGIQKDTLLVAPYEDLVELLIDNPVRPISQRLPSRIEPNPLLLFLSSTIFWIIGLLGSLFGKRRKLSGIVVLLMLIAAFAVIGFALPTLIHPSLNYIAMLLLQTTCLGIYMLKVKKVQEKAKENACKANMRTLASQVVVYKYPNKVLPQSTPELLAEIPLFAQIVCPSCRARFTYKSDGENFEIMCPNKPSHGRVKNGKVSWEEN